jgi:hypothetical protein
MWSTFTCRATTSPVAATAARASSSSSRRAEKRFATVGGSAHAAGRRVALKAAAEGAATEETEDVIPRVEGEFVWDEDRPFHRCGRDAREATERDTPPTSPIPQTRLAFFFRHSHAKKSDVFFASKHTFHGTKKIPSARRLTPSYCPSFPSRLLIASFSQTPRLGVFPPGHARRLVRRLGPRLGREERAKSEGFAIQSSLARDVQR